MRRSLKGLSPLGFCSPARSALSLLTFFHPISEFSHESGQEFFGVGRGDAAGGVKEASGVGQVNFRLGHELHAQDGDDAAQMGLSCGCAHIAGGETGDGRGFARPGVLPVGAAAPVNSPF